MTEVDLDIHHSGDAVTDALRADVVAGLTAEQKWLPPKWFYDAEGSELFEKITQLPEYYPTRAEREILAARSGEVARATGAHTLVELGSGSSEKTRLLLDAFTGHGTLEAFVPLDVSESALADDTPYLQLRVLGRDRLGGVGNFLPAERAGFLRSVREVLDEGEWLLLGTDLVKDAGILERAYDDAAGVTAEFNKNVLRVINARLGADFDVDEFEHVAHWDAENEWIEMRLRARRELTTRIPGADLTVEFAAGEHVRTEISAKFRPRGVEAELAAAGFAVEHWWTDSQQRFGVGLARSVRG